MQSNLNNTDEFVLAYKSFDKCRRAKVLSYYNECNHLNEISKLSTFFVVFAFIVFILGGIFFTIINQNSNQVRLENESINLNASMSKSDKIKSVRMSLDSLRTNEFDSIPKVDLASFEF